MENDEISNRYRLSINLAEKYSNGNYTSIEIGASFPEFSIELQKRDIK